jgi:hypothetical protein
VGVSRLLGRIAARRVHVLPVEVGGYWLLRVEVERDALARGWCVALSPADADVMAVCGIPGPELLEIIDRVWEEMPGPRVRVDVASCDTIHTALDGAVVKLVDPQRYRDDSARTLRLLAPADDHGAMQHEDHQGAMQVDGHGHAAMQHEDPQQMHSGAQDDGMQHGGDTVHAGGHDGMHHGHGELAPAGIALAEGGADRDGLELDVLHVHLGPALAHWPAGLVLRCSIQGDVLIAAEASIIDDRHGDQISPAGAGRAAATTAARHCQPIIDVLSLAGWAQAAAIARQARDSLLSQQQIADAQALLEKLDAKVRRSRTLRWSLRDLLPLSADDLSRLGLPAVLEGDVYDRLRAHIARTRDLLVNPLRDNEIADDPARIIGALPDLVVGLELSTARLAVASLGIETAPSGENRSDD